MSTANLFWGGLVLGSTDDDTTRLRVLSTPGNPGVSGLGHPRPDADLVRRLVGGVHIGAVRPGEREIEAPLLQTRSWGVATRFVDSMSPGPDLRWLEIEGGPYPNRVALHVAPMGATPRWDVDSLGDREVIHVEGARWVAPDPTVYSAETIEFSGSNTSPVTLTNAGAGVPLRGLGGHAWTMWVWMSQSSAYATVESWDPVTSTVVDSVRLQPASGGFLADDVITIGPDRVPTLDRGGTVLPVMARSGSPLVPSPEWPRFPAGRTLQLRVTAATGGTVFEGEFRHTWS